MNVPPMAAAERLLTEAWGKVRRRAEFSKAFNYGAVEGPLEYRQLMSRWLSHTAGVDPVDASRIVITNGAQGAMDLAFSTLCKTGDAILVEELTFSGIKAIAQYRGYRLVPVAMDEQGILPEALAAAAQASGARVLYTMPTLQNPTARILSLARRQELIAVARRLTVALVEDDVYAPYVERRDAPPPLVNLAPDITYYVSSLSKSLAPGLRTGVVIAPSAVLAARVAVGLRVSAHSAQSMGLLITQQAIEDGSAEQILKENRRLLSARSSALRTALNLRPERLASMSPHVWLPASHDEATRLEAQLLAENVRITGISDPVVDFSRGCGLRFCVGAPRRDADFERAVAAIQRVLNQPPDLSLRAAV
jgi:DNA-binding transcriptional MocR family regulator